MLSPTIEGIADTLRGELFLSKIGLGESASNSKTLRNKYNAQK